MQIKVLIKLSWESDMEFFKNLPDCKARNEKLF